MQFSYNRIVPPNINSTLCFSFLDYLASNVEDSPTFSTCIRDATSWVDFNSGYAAHALELCHQ